MKASDLRGGRFGRLTVISRDYDAPAGKAKWFCRCECGNKPSVLGASLTAGRTKSCGCWREVEIGLRSFKHGASACRDNLPEYQTWQDMRRRCRDEKRKDFKRYGGRGIKVCERWDGDFEAFYTDMGPRPSPKHSIDRIDNDGDYAPGNCRWARNTEQARNRSSCRVVKLAGVEMSATEAAERVGMKPSCLLSRLGKGWPTDYALSAPLGATWPPAT